MNIFRLRVTQKKLIWILIVFSAASLAFSSWVFASPPIAANHDDDYHRASIWCGLGEREQFCESVPGLPGRLVAGQEADVNQCFVRDKFQSGACLPLESNELFYTERLNINGGYPPLYYWAMSHFASDDIYSSVLIIRIINSLLYVFLGFLLFFTLPRQLKSPLLIGCTVGLIPLGINLISSINPSSWSITSATYLWVAIAGFALATSSKEKLGFAGISIFLATLGAGARADSAIYNIISLTVVIILYTSGISHFLRHSWLYLTILIFSLSLFLQAGQAASAASNFNTIDKWQLLQNILRLPELWVGVFGTWPMNHGFDTYLPGIVWITVMFVWAGIQFSNAKYFNFKKVFSVSIILFALVVVPLRVLSSNQVLFLSPWEDGATYEVSPRYILPLIVILGGVALAPRGKEEIRLYAPQYTIAILGLSIANSISLYSNIRRYTTGVDVMYLSLDTNFEWWWQAIPVSPMFLWMMGSLSFGICLVVAYLSLLRNSKAPNYQ